MYTETYTHTHRHLRQYARENGDNEEAVALSGIEREGVNSKKELNRFRLSRLMTTGEGRTRRCRTLRYYCN